MYCLECNYGEISSNTKILREPYPWPNFEVIEWNCIKFAGFAFSPIIFKTIIAIFYILHNKAKYEDLNLFTVNFYLVACGEKRGLKDASKTNGV